MKLKELLRDIPVTEMSADPETEIGDIRYDSRAVGQGDLFVAVEGYQSDGHRFIPMAAERGAAAVLCQKKPETDVPYILTPNSRRALALASAAFFGYPAEQLVMIGVTGTNGKTTSTTLIKHMLETCTGKKVGLIGTIANLIGDEVVETARTTPESYELQKLLRRMADAGCEYAVMEVSSHALVLDRVAGIRFRAGLFTNLTQDHLDFHKTMKDYAAAKSLLFTVSDAAAINVDDIWAPYMGQSADCPVLGFSAKERGADLSASDIRYAADGVSFTAHCGSESVPVVLGIPGQFTVSNALTVLAAGILLDLPLSEAAASLGTAQGVKGRVEVVPTPEDYTVVIDYAHTPDALEKVLKTMKAVAKGRVVAVFGCGGDRDATKRPIMGRIAAENADFTVVTSDNPRSEQPEAIIADIVAGMPEDAPKQVICDRREAIFWALAHHEPEDVIVLAGKGHETYQEIRGVKNHMDEREIVADYLNGSER